MEIKNNLVSQVEEAEEQNIEPLVAEIQSKFQACSNKRQDDENRWLQAYHNYPIITAAKEL